MKSEIPNISGYIHALWNYNDDRLFTQHYLLGGASWISGNDRGQIMFNASNVCDRYSDTATEVNPLYISHIPIIKY